MTDRATFELIEQCRDALAEELRIWGTRPSVDHVKQAHDKCVEWLIQAATPTDCTASTAERAIAEMIELDDGLGTVYVDFILERPPAGTKLYTNVQPSLQSAQPAQPVQPESKPCFMCHGQGWHYIAHAYPPGVTVPKIKMTCTQCVAQPVQPPTPKSISQA